MRSRAAMTVPGGKRPCEMSGVESQLGLLGCEAPVSGRDAGRGGAACAPPGAIVSASASGNSARVISSDRSTDVPHKGQNRASCERRLPQVWHEVTRQILPDAEGAIDQRAQDVILDRRSCRRRKRAPLRAGRHPMAQASAESPKRAWFKAAEVCELAQVQPYVLRTWEIEFADLGTARTPGGPRVYRRADVDRVLRIKQLVFTEGLTLAGARRRIEEDRGGAADELPFDDEPVPAAGGTLPAAARKRVAKVRDELRALLTMLSRPRGNGGAPVPVAAAASATPARPARASSTKAAKPAAARGRKTTSSRGK